jgi:hypothetical protein
MKVSVKYALAGRGTRIENSSVAIKTSILSKICGALKHFCRD